MGLRYSGLQHESDGSILESFCMEVVFLMARNISFTSSITSFKCVCLGYFWKNG